MCSPHSVPVGGISAARLRPVDIKNVRARRASRSTVHVCHALWQVVTARISAHEKSAVYASYAFRLMCRQSGSRLGQAAASSRVESTRPRAASLAVGRLCRHRRERPRGRPRGSPRGDCRVVRSRVGRRMRWPIASAHRLRRPPVPSPPRGPTAERSARSHDHPLLPPGGATGCPAPRPLRYAISCVRLELVGGASEGVRGQSWQTRCSALPRGRDEGAGTLVTSL